MDFGKLLGFAWASPLTLCGLVYVLVFQLMGWYKWHGVRGDALVWITNPSAMPGWLYRRWNGLTFDLGGVCVGNVIVMDVADFAIDSIAWNKILIHEMTHVKQCMRLGIFQPLLYGSCTIALSLLDKNVDSYYDNPFENHARRAAGQVVDVVGAKRRLTELTVKVKDRS